MRVREATAGDLPAVANVLDGAALALDHDDLRAAIDRNRAIVAVRDSGEGGTDGTDDADGTGSAGGTVLGALLLDDDRVTAVAVRRNRRGQGIGSALIAAAADRRDRLVAEFDAGVRPFYESLGFSVEPADGSGRYRGVLERR